MAEFAKSEIVTFSHLIQAHLAQWALDLLLPLQLRSIYGLVYLSLYKAFHILWTIVIVPYVTRSSCLVTKCDQVIFSILLSLSSSSSSPPTSAASALSTRKHDPGARVLCVEGDSAFGFSGMEFETMARYCHCHCNSHCHRHNDISYSNMEFETLS